MLFVCGKNIRVNCGNSGQNDQNYALNLGKPKKYNG